MAGRPKIYDEDKALDRAIEVFWKKGYENASSEDLLKAMGIGKGSFYLAYKGGKPELFEKSMQRVITHHLSGFLSNLKTCDEPIEAIRHYFYMMADLKSPVGKHGCYFGNAVLQIEDKALKRVAAEQLQLITNAFVEGLKRAKKLGQLKSDLPVELLGLNLLNLWSGVNVVKNIEIDPERLRAMIDLNLQFLH